MGTDKALLDLGAGPMAVQAAVLLASHCASVALVGDPARYADLGYEVVPDKLAGAGPLAGIEAALDAAAAEWNLVVACDMPSLDGEVIEALFEAAKSCDAALPRHADGRLEPLCAVYNKRCHAAVASALAAGIRKVTDGLQGLAVRYVQTGGAGMFANLNTPEDVRKHQNG